MKKDKDVIDNTKNKKEYEAPEIEVNKFNNSGDPVEMFAEDVVNGKIEDSTKESDKVTESAVVDNQNAEPSEKSNGNSKKIKKPHKRLSKKQKIVIISIFTIILLVAILILSWLAYEKKQNEWNLITETVTTEYGSVYEPELSDFVEFTSKVTEDNTSLKYEFVYEKEYDENGEETGNYLSYPSVSDYSVIITHTVEYSLFGINIFVFDEEQTAVVSVVDTTAPEFLEEIATEIITYQNVEIDADTLAEKFEVYDLSDVELSIDDSVIDYETVGEYETTVCAKDIYNNVTTINVVVKVKEPSITIDETNLSLAVGDTYQLNVSVHGESSEVTYTSSDKSVVTVDENGVVTAVAKGTATVTAESNGIESSVTVAVTSVLTSSDTTSSSNSSTDNNSGSSNKTVTNSNNTSSNSSNTNSSSTNSSSKSSTNNSSSSSSTTSTTLKCYEGGTVHAMSPSTYLTSQYAYFLSEGYDSYSEAQSALSAYARENDISVKNYLIYDCFCGTFFVKYNVR